MRTSSQATPAHSTPTPRIEAAAEQKSQQWRAAERVQIQLLLMPSTGINEGGALSAARVSISCCSVR